MVIAQPIKREIEIIANQHKAIELDFFGNVKFLYAGGVFILKNEDKDACFLLLFLNPKIEHSGFASKYTGKIDLSKGNLLVFDVYMFEPIISLSWHYHWFNKAILINSRKLWFSKIIVRRRSIIYSVVFQGLKHFTISFCWNNLQIEVARYMHCRSKK